MNSEKVQQTQINMFLQFNHEIKKIHVEQNVVQLFISISIKLNNKKKLEICSQLKNSKCYFV